LERPSRQRRGVRVERLVETEARGVLDDVGELLVEERLAFPGVEDRLRPERGELVVDRTEARGVELRLVAVDVVVRAERAGVIARRDGADFEENGIHLLAALPAGERVEVVVYLRPVKLEVRHAQTRPSGNARDGGDRAAARRRP